MIGDRIVTLRRLFEAATRDGKPQRFYEDLREGLAKKHLRPDDFSIRELFEQFVPNGRELVSQFDPRKQGNPILVTRLEAEGAVKTSHFSNISGQIIYSTILEEWANPMFIADELVTTVKTQFNGERIAGISGIGDEAQIVGEANPYPLAGPSEQYIDTPMTTKRGFIVPVTKEAIFFDRTGLLLQRARKVTEWLRINKEKRVLDTVLGITTSYRRNGAAAIATYQTSTPFINSSSNPLVNYTDIENAELLFDAMTDPDTGEPVMVMADTIIVPTALKNTSKQIVSATEIRKGDGASDTTVTISANPLERNYKVLSSPFVKARTSSASTWFLGAPKKAFAYMENWPIAAVEAPVNSEMEFTHDIISRTKVSERGEPAVLEPRYMTKNT